jgi:ubiquitin C-terminal hydrolase
MGCTQSKAVAAPAPKPATDGGGALSDPIHNPGGLQKSGSFHSRNSQARTSRDDNPAKSLAASPARKSKAVVKSMSNGSLHKKSPAPVSSAVSKTTTSSNTRTSAGQWKVLWETLPHPVDPADVPAVIADLMARQINKLSPTEITLMQRKIRNMSNSTPQQKKGGRFRMAAETTPVEKQHLLDDYIVRKLWSMPTLSSSEIYFRFHVQSDPADASIDLVGSATVLLSHLGEPLWERAALIAADAADEAGLEMDVNKKSPGEDKIAPQPPALEQFASQTVLGNGISFHSVCFLQSLALRGTREQQLQLLFYLLLPPMDLTEFLMMHPAGGVPTWLLEVDQDTVISLTSMAHYFYFGNVFSPKSTLEEKRRIGGSSSLLQLSPLQVMETIASLLSQKQQVNGNATVEKKKSPVASFHSTSRHRRASETPDNSTAATEANGAVSAVMDYMQSHPNEYQLSDEYMNRYLTACEARIGDAKWDMEVFSQFANEALDNKALDIVMHRIFGSLPAAESERNMILDRWQQWQQADVRFWTLEEEQTHSDTLDYLSHSLQHFFRTEPQNGDLPTAATRVWGGIGGFDGRGGLGHGIMHCVEREWWQQWEDYVGWNWEADKQIQPRIRKRPGPISTDKLIDRSEEAPVGGTLGSYEVMKPGLIKGVDYVLVPPGVWDVLFELYGGGPPLPRMVLPPPRMERRTRTFSTDSKQMEDEDVVSSDASVEVVSHKNGKVLRIPEALAVATHPLVLHVQVCDAQQPYRRGDAGPMSIRVMATPDQPLWRLYSEVIVRLPIQNSKAMDRDGRGQARLWRNVEPDGQTDALSRYGPWSLLCKNRSAILPVTNLDLEFEDNYDELKKDWRKYTDHATVEGIGLINGDKLMLEYAIQNKAGDFIWPREAAAKASRMRRIADDELKFRRLLRGVDDEDNAISPPPKLVGMEIDAMDISGRWFQVEILEVQIDEEAHDHDEEVTDGPAQNGGGSDQPTVTKEIRVDFTEFGGHSEWINVESDRLATAGRFTFGKPDDDDSDEKSSSTKNGSEAKSKSGVTLKKTNGEVPDQNAGKVCTFPGYGACGLANLGNTCYANSAIQCISYMPLLRAYLLSAQYKANGDLNKDNPLGTGGKLLEEFAELLRVMWMGKYGERSPNRFRSQLGKARSQFAGADQQDAQEFLNYILDVLHEDSNKIKKKPYVEAVEDDWVENNSLQRVGEESWRRFLRRNRSVMADVAMGQVLNTVTCPVCNFSSRNFDPFNLLSLPFPTVADVVFVCTVIRRGTPLNSPRILNRPRKGEKKKRYDLKKLKANPNIPSDTLVIEEYAIAMSRLADIGDLKLRLQNICGIPANNLKLCKLDELTVMPEAADENPVKTHQKITPLPDKEGPCVQLARTLSSSDDVTKPSSPTRIVAFEKTIRPRPVAFPEKRASEEDKDRLTDEDEATTADEDEDIDSVQDSRAYSPKERQLVLEQLKQYGDKTECRLYDSDPLDIQKAMSRSLWPKKPSDFKLGLRVDAIDHREHWFPGSVIEIIEDVADENAEEKAETVTKVRVHFDNFSSKWDETYEIEAFTSGQVQPLYSHATPRSKPTEFIVLNRYTDRKLKKTILFGQDYYLQCPPEWSTARAGAHVLAQASRFMQKPELSPSRGPVDVDEISDEEINMTTRIFDKAFSAVNELIDILIDYDRKYTLASLGVSDDGKDLLGDDYRNTEYDGSEFAASMAKKVSNILPKLPFEVRLIALDIPGSGGTKSSINEEQPFPFSCMRTIGNFVNARHAIALHWREPPLDKSYIPKTFVDHPILYQAPPTAIHKSSTDVKNESNAHASKNNPGSGGMDLSVCLTEFCKTQKLELAECWRCPRCKEFREGKQHMDIWRLPDLLTFHIKRFNCSARWREKITTKVNFPLTGLDMSDWCHSESVCVDNVVFDLIGVMNHYGGMTGGHYVATCKATACGPDGQEEVAFSFPGAGTNMALVSDEADKVGWRLGGIRKEKEMVNQNKVSAAAAAKYASESAEPLWLQFDDELVEPIPPRNVVSEMAYVLFYRRRQLTPANIAKYSTLE